MPWLARPGGRVPPRPDVELTAVTGQFDTSRRTGAGKPWSPSEARFAVLCSAAARGWQLAEVTERMRSGAWDGLAAFYGRYRPGRQRAGRLAADWRKAVAVAAGEKSGRNSDTRENHHRGGDSPRCGDFARCRVADDYREIRRWDSALRVAERNRWPGRHGLTVRLVMRGLAAAAQMTGSVVIEFGTRAVGMLAGVDHCTAARVLRELREEPDPFIVLLEGRRGVRGDLYLLRVPDEYAEAARWRRWRPGRIGVHQVFRALGGAAALVCEQLTSEPVRTMDLPVMTGLSPTAVSMALAELGAHGIAVRGRGGWRRGPADLDELAARLGIPEQLAELQAQYRKERQIWRGLLMQVRAPATPAALPALDNVPWPEGVPLGDGWQASDVDAARGPPNEAAVIAALEAELGTVAVISAASQ